MNEMEKNEWGARLIEESMKVDDQIRSQIQKIQEIRKQTQDAINTSASVVNAYNYAQDSFREHIEAKRYAHLGNENFVNRLYPNPKRPYNFQRRVSQPVAQSVRTIVRHAPVTAIKEEEVSPSKAQIDAYRK